MSQDNPRLNPLEGLSPEGRKVLMVSIRKTALKHLAAKLLKLFRRECSHGKVLNAQGQPYETCDERQRRLNARWPTEAEEKAAMEQPLE